MTAPPPWWLAGVRCACPRCGEGKLFAGLLAVRDQCGACTLDLRAHDSGDGRAVIVMFFVSIVVLALAFWVEFRFAPALWVHALLWPAVTLPLAVALMRPLKAAMIALQFQHRHREMGL